MKTHLLYRDQDVDLKQPFPINVEELTQDLSLEVLFGVMARGDKFIYDVVRRVVFNSISDLNTIRYRQDILRDCLKNSSVIRQIYQIPIESMQNKYQSWMGIFSKYPTGILSSAITMMEMFVGLLKKLKAIADEHADKFESEGFSTFFAMIKQELNEEYFAVVEDHLQQLKFRKGVLLSAELGQGSEAINYTLRKPNGKSRNWMKQVFAQRSPVYTFYIHPRDEHGGRALSDIRDRGINMVANALAQSADHIDSFLNMLRVELAFYIGCINLAEQMEQIGKPICFPDAAEIHERRHSFSDLYDICLALTMKQKVVSNTVNADGKDLVIITGANQGGKSTFLRSIGLAQLMMQCGMFVPAESLCANVCAGIFTHYKRKEDASMKSGKLDEELSRMSAIADQIKPNGMILFNESFAATNEREGSEIARQIVSALLARGIVVFFVTHQYEFARGFYDKKMKNVFFLRAERKADGGRTYRVVEGEPLQTSYGKDLYHKIFNQAAKVSQPEDESAIGVANESYDDRLEG